MSDQEMHFAKKRDTTYRVAFNGAAAVFCMGLILSSVKQDYFDAVDGSIKTKGISGTCEEIVHKNSEEFADSKFSKDFIQSDCENWLPQHLNGIVDDVSKSRKIMLGSLASATLSFYAWRRHRRRYPHLNKPNLF